MATVGCHGNGPQHRWITINTRVATAHPSHNPNAISIGAVVVAGLTSVTDGQTNRPRYSVGSTSTAMRPNKNIALLWLK